MTSVERPSTITGAQTIDVDGSDKTKQVCKAGLPPASTRSYFAKNPLLPPFQSKGQEIISGSTLRDELAYEESEQIEAVNKTEAGLMENTYRIAPDPRKKFSSGKLRCLITILLPSIFTKGNVISLIHLQGCYLSRAIGFLAGVYNCCDVYI